MERISCNLCGAQNDQELYVSDRFRAVICRDCTLVYLNPRMTQGEYTKYYTEEYQKNRHIITTYKEAVERLEKKGSYEVKKQLLPVISKYITPTSRVLEVGSGWGTLLRLIVDTFGCSVLGLEISALAVEVSKTFYKIPTETETLESFISKKQSGTFDFVIMYHVLEHILDPVTALRNLQNVIADKGVLYIAVPNMAAPDEDISKFFRLEHPYYFTPETLTKILKKSGYQIVEMIINPNDIQVVARVSGGETNKPNEKATDQTASVYSVSYITNVVRRQRAIEYVKSVLRPIKRSLQSWLR